MGRHRIACDILAEVKAGDYCEWDAIGGITCLPLATRDRL